MTANDAAFGTLDEKIVRAMNKYVLSGMAVGVVRDGRLVYAKGFGLANARENKPVTSDTVFRIASISKTFTALAVMQLWEQGKFQLDEPVNRYLKTYQVVHPDPSTPPITIRHLLTHTSGLGESRSARELLKEAVLQKSEDSYRPDQEMPSLGEYYQGRLVSDVAPEKKWAYANHGFATLGQMIEDISGEPFSEYMRRHVFEPLGMLKTDFDLSDRVKAELAQGYVFKKGRLKPVDYMQFPGRAAGSVLTSVSEMSMYLSALMNGGCNEHGTIIQPETLRMMMTPQYQPDPHLAAMGLGFFLEDLDSHPAAWHGGSLEGFNSALWVAPADRMGIVVFANSNTRAIYSLAQGWLRDLIGLPDVEKRFPVPGMLASPHLWQELVGTYGLPRGFNSNARSWMTFGGEIDIAVKGNQLVLKSLTGPYTKGITLYPVDRDNPLVFQNVTDGKTIQIAFERGPAGVVDRLHMTALSFYSFYKQPVTQSVRFRLYTAAGTLAGSLAAALLLGRKRKPRQ